MKLSVIVPVYNEAATLPEVLRRVRGAGYEVQLVVVDDCSSDGSREYLHSIEGDPDVTAVYHPENRGKGAAVRSGLAHVEGDLVLIQDADLEYDPADYPRLLAPILDGHADVVYGSRFRGGGPSRVHLYWHEVANRFLTMLSNMFTNLNLSDMETCYKVFRRELLDGVQLVSNRFGIEPELTAKVARMRVDGRRVRIYEVPISYHGRDYYEGKKIGWKDGVAAIWHILRFNIFG